MNPNNGSVLKLEGMDIGYSENKVLENVGLSINEGEVLAIVGQNGSGKSTLLKAISGLVPRTSGQITINSRPLASMTPDKMPELNIAYFMQGGLIMPALTVEEHLALAARNGMGDDVVFDHFPTLRPMKKRLAGNLSGGERQLLSLGMLLLKDAKIWLLDEPTAGLSPSMVNFTREFLQKKKQQGDVTMLLVEHNMDVAFALADSMVVAEQGTLTRKHSRDEFLSNDFESNYLFH